jgi:hypothetical protein
VGWKWYAAASLQSRSALWLKLDEATSAEQLEGIIKDSGGTQAARVARFELARYRLRHGLEKLSASMETERTDAVKHIQEAEQFYLALGKEVKGSNPLLEQEALLGVAKARESLGDLDGALQSYNDLVKAFPDTPIGKETAEYVKKLESNKAKVAEFYAALKKFNEPRTPEKSDTPQKQPEKQDPSPKKPEPEQPKEKQPEKTEPRDQKPEKEDPKEKKPEKDESREKK